MIRSELRKVKESSPGSLAREGTAAGLPASCLDSLRAAGRLRRPASTEPPLLQRREFHGRLGLAARLALLFALDALEDLFPVYGNILRRVDAHTHLVALYA